MARLLAARKATFHRGGTAMKRWVAGVLVLAFSLLLGGCFGAYQVTADNPVGAGSLKPTVEDKDAGLVGIADGFDVKAYKIVVVDQFPVTDPEVKDEGDRRLASSMASFFQSELVRRLRESGLFVRVVNLTETEWRLGAEPALRLEGKITRLGEGSQALRAMFGLYGAGKARAQAELIFTDVRRPSPLW
jgi:hypothetical protein